MAAENFNFAPKFPQNGGFSAPNLAFLDKNVPTRNPVNFPTAQNLGKRERNCPFYPLSLLRRFLSPQLGTSLHCETTDTGLVHRVPCPVYAPAIVGTHCIYPRRGGQAELTWVAGCIPRWFTRLQTVTHLSTNRARR